MFGLTTATPLCPPNSVDFEATVVNSTSRCQLAFAFQLSRADAEVTGAAIKNGNFYAQLDFLNLVS